MIDRTLIAPGIVLLMVCGGCMAAPPPSAPATWRVEASGPSPGAEALRARIGPVFADDDRSPVPNVGVGAPTYEGATGIAQGAIALVRDRGGEAHIAVFEAATGKEVKTSNMPPWGGTSAPRVSADGRYLAYLTRAQARQELVLWDLMRDQRVQIPALQEAAIREVDLSGNGDRLIYLKGGVHDASLCVYDRTSGDERVIPVQPGRLSALRSPTLSGDGQTAAFVAASARGDANVFIVDLSTLRPISPPTLNTVDQERDPALDARGNVLLFTSDRNGSFDLFAYDLKSGQYLDVGMLNSLEDETMPRVIGSADDGLAYVSTRDGGPVAYMHPLRRWR